MKSSLQDKGQSIVETSLTELAFIFFFILLIFSTLKINSLITEKSDSDQLVNSLTEQMEMIQEQHIQFGQSHAVMRRSLSLPDIDLDEPFLGLEETTRGVVTVAEVAKTFTDRLRGNHDQNFTLLELSEKIEQLTVLEDKYGDTAKVLEALEQFVQINEGNSDLNDYFSDIRNEMANLRGQNQNMRTRLNNLGNGLVYPPCWANPETGTIEYVYNVTIEEDSLTVEAAWPSSRDPYVDRSPHIRNALGSYAINREFIIATQRLFEESRTLDCRHFVRIYDNAISKDAFKAQLLTVENHFYKYLVP